MIKKHIELSSRIASKKREIVEQVYKLRIKENPALLQRYSAADVDTFHQDCAYHLDFLSHAIAYDSKAVFDDYILWVRRLFQHLPVSDESLAVFFRSFADVVTELTDPDDEHGLKNYLDASLQLFEEPLPTSVSFLDIDKHTGIVAQQLLDMLLQGKKDEASDYIMAEVNAGMPIKECYLDVFQPLQYEIGRMWHAGEISVGQEHYITAVTQMLMSQFYPLIMNHPSNGKRIVASCISGEQHEVGLRMLSDLMEIAGWDTMFLGANTPLATVPDSVVKWQADVLAVSVTLSTHLAKLSQLIGLCRNKLPELKIIVGGYPFNLDKSLWLKVGADGYAENALQAIDVANGFVSRS